MRGTGRTIFVAILLFIAGALNVIYGFGAIGNATFFTANASFVFANLHTWGWITVILGVIQLTAGFSLMQGNTYGRVIGIIAAALGAFESLLAIGGNYPFWSIGVFALCLWILYGLVLYGEDAKATDGTR
jgi:hypothetical protein